MDFIVIALVACLASLLTFFSGFGLGTILTPAFVLFFPPEMAIALTGIVHLLNNLFKLGLVGKHINLKVLLAFGIPAFFTAYLGASLLLGLAHDEALWQYELAGTTYSVLPVNLVIAGLMLIFAIQELIPQWRNIALSNKWLIPGGMLSGFFGGLSGHQGALRSIFLLRTGLTKEAFIATGVSIACLVDVSRLSRYFFDFTTSSATITGNLPILITATLAAFVGAIIGKKVLTKITINFVQVSVAVLMIIISIGLGLGILSKH